MLAWAPGTGATGHLQTYADLVMSLNPVAYWRLGEASGTTAVDRAGTQNGTYVNTPTLGAAGALTGDADTGVTLASASSEHVTIADAPALRLAVDWTLSAWIKTSSVTGRILSKRIGGTASYELYLQAPGNVIGYVNDGVTSGTPASLATVADGEWHYVVLVRAGAGATFYIDGEAEAPLSHGVTGSTAGTDAMALGTYGNIGGDFFNGTMDEVAIWDRALTAPEVASLYAAGTTAPVNTHPYNLEINGVDHIGMVPGFGASGASFGPPISVEMAGPGSNGSLTFTIIDPDASVTINEWDEVRFIEHAATRPILFGGFVQSVRYVAWATGGRNIEVQCVGYGILLDKKVYVDLGIPFSYNVDTHVQRIVSRSGSGITATMAATLQSPDATNGIPNYASLIGSAQRWLYSAFLSGGSSYAPPSPSMLRGAIEWYLRQGISDRDWSATLTVVPVPGMYWVDSARMFRLLADGSASEHADWAEGGADFAGQWDGGTTALAIDDAGTYRVVSIEYEREDTDRVTSAYIAGGNAAATGYYRTPGLTRAGDLEALVEDSTLLGADDIPGRGSGEVGQTTLATARGTVVLQSSTTLAVWPGRRLTVDFATVSLADTSDWRITSTRIAFQSAASRTYTIGFGGNAPAPSLANRTGRYATR